MEPLGAPAPLVLAPSLLEPARGEKRVRQRVMRIGELGIELDRAPEVLDRQLKCSLNETSLTEIEMNYRRARRASERPLEDSSSLLRRTVFDQGGPEVRRDLRPFGSGGQGTAEPGYSRLGLAVHLIANREIGPGFGIVGPKRHGSLKRGTCVPIFSQSIQRESEIRMCLRHIGIESSCAAQQPLGRGRVPGVKRN